MPYLTASAYTRRPRTDTIVIHCSDTTSHQNVGVDEIRQWHIKERGWKDVGYHFVITRDGTIQPGRPEWAMAAAVVDDNDHTLNICLVGGRGAHGEEENNFTPAQFTSLETLLAALFQQYPGILASRHPVMGHRDFPSGKAQGKYCPSFDAQAWFAQQEPTILAMVVPGSAPWLS